MTTTTTTSTDTTVPASSSDAAIYQRTLDKSQDKLFEKATKTGKEFESMVMSEMLTPMFEGLDTKGTFGGGSGESAYRTFLIQELGKSAATQSGGLGLGKAVVNSLLSLQEMNNGETNDGRNTSG